MILLKHWDIDMANAAYMNSYGKRQRLLRMDLQMTQKDLADAVTRHGVQMGQGYVSELERTDKVPLGDVVAAVAKVLNTSTDFLLQMTDDATPLNDINNKDNYISPQAGEAATIIDNLDEDTRDAVMALLRYMDNRDTERRDLHVEMAALLTAGITHFDDTLRKNAQALLSRISQRSPGTGTQIDLHHT